MSKPVRVRFAPSPTGPLHIGGVRTALYNYLFAKKHNGTFILRIEDTDQMRYVPGAEEYIMEALTWVGLVPEEGPGIGGKYGPYRQSERKDIYGQYCEELITRGKAYYAFDTPEELDVARTAAPDDTFKYDHTSRAKLKNSLSMSEADTKAYLDSGNYVVRLLIPKDESITFEDEIRGTVTFSSNELDDKVILKADGMPTYHLANILDDHLMDISHVIRGEEWLSSTAHHVLMYKFFGWEAPAFAHLPLILKPTGQGKLSKRDGAKFGFPVFPIDWVDEEESFPGFREDGMLPDALINFLALLGWSPGNDQEIMTREEMINLFSLEKIVKSGARFDIDKAKWFNQQYLMAMPNRAIALMLVDQAAGLGYSVDVDKLAYCAAMMKERVQRVQDILLDAHFLFEYPKHIDKDTLDKKLKPENNVHFETIAEAITNAGNQNKDHLEFVVKDYISTHQLKMGEIMPVLRIALTGTTQGPDMFDTLSFLGSKESASRILKILG